MASAGCGLRASPTLGNNTFNFQFTAIFPSHSDSQFDFRVIDLKGCDQASMKQLRSDLFSDEPSIRTKLVIHQSDLRPEQVVDCTVQNLGLSVLFGVRERIGDQAEIVTKVFETNEIAGQCVHWAVKEFMIFPEAMTEEKVKQAIADAKNNGEE